MVASANMFYIAIDYKNEANMKVVAGNILFSKQLIVVVCMTVVQQKISKDLTQLTFE